jgi:hypothetical protein
VIEDRWQNIVPKTGNQTTALDGWSETTRRRVRKPVSDRQIIETLTGILREISGIMRLKVFQIVGYPWETAESLQDDLDSMKDVLSRVSPPKSAKSRIMMMVTVTPFSPEPLTHMQNEPANITDNWRGILLNDKNRCLFNSDHLNAFILPQIPGPLLLSKRVAVNRCADSNLLRKIHRTKSVEDVVKLCGEHMFAKQAGHYLDSIITRGLK